MIRAERHAPSCTDPRCNPELRRLRVYIEPRDAWIGAYVAEHAVYVCPLPFLVFRWTRRG